MTSQPLVSIITPAYNQAAWLPDCLESVARQTYRPLEHIVVDDGSTDSTPQILEQSSAPVKWVRQENAGQSAALNRAISMAQGDVIGWLNSDDAYFDVTAVAAAVEAFRRHPKVDVAYGHAALVNSEGFLLDLIWAPRFNARLFRFTNFIVQPAAFIRRSAIPNPFVDESYQYAMDRDLWMRLLTSSRFKRLRAITAADRHQPLRKGIARRDLIVADTDRLIMSHRLSSEFRYVRLHKLFDLVRRVAGAMLLPRFTRVRQAFDATNDGILRLLWRQLTMPKSAMPYGIPKSRLAVTDPNSSAP